MWKAGGRYKFSGNCDVNVDGARPASWMSAEGLPHAAGGAHIVASWGAASSAPTNPERSAANGGAAILRRLEFG